MTRIIIGIFVLLALFGCDKDENKSVRPGGFDPSKFLAIDDVIEIEGFCCRGDEYVITCNEDLGLLSECSVDDITEITDVDFDKRTLIGKKIVLNNTFSYNIKKNVTFDEKNNIFNLLIKVTKKGVNYETDKITKSGDISKNNTSEKLLTPIDNNYYDSSYEYCVWVLIPKFNPGAKVEFHTLFNDATKQ